VGILLTRHAREVIAERGLEQDWIERVLRNPVVVEADPSDPKVMRAYGPVPERGGRMLRVVYTLGDDGIRVLTAFLDRRATRI
jgi:hypothetical protein